MACTEESPRLSPRLPVPPGAPARGQEHPSEQQYQKNKAKQECHASTPTQALYTLRLLPCRTTLHPTSHRSGACLQRLTGGVHSVTRPVPCAKA